MCAGPLDGKYDEVEDMAGEARKKDGRVQTATLGYFILGDTATRLALFTPLPEKASRLVVPVLQRSHSTKCPLCHCQLTPACLGMLHEAGSTRG